MLVKRTVSALILLTISLSLVFAGGWIFIAGVAFILSGAAWEFIDLFIKGGYHPNPYPLVLGTAGIISIMYLDDPVFTSLVYALTVFSILLFATLTMGAMKKPPPSTLRLKCQHCCLSHI